jgi:hypothetical protein
MVVETIHNRYELTDDDIVNHNLNTDLGEDIPFSLPEQPGNIEPISVQERPLNIETTHVREDVEAFLVQEQPYNDDPSLIDVDSVSDYGGGGTGLNLSDYENMLLPENGNGSSSYIIYAYVFIIVVIALIIGAFYLIKKIKK